MRLADAPAPGWYPDPEGGSGLRWWEGTDWTEHRRSPPTRLDLEAVAEASQAASAAGRRVVTADRETEADVAEIVAEARAATRREIDRAARQLTDDIRTSISGVRPTIIGYITRILRWIRIAVVTAAVLVVAWFVLQFIAQVTFLSWLGDRIDNLSG